MRKLLVILLVVLLLVVFVVGALPVSAKSPQLRFPGGTEPPYGPPGWSHQNPGGGGTEPPGPGGG
jgi:hypothetical protein